MNATQTPWQALTGPLFRTAADFGAFLPELASIQNKPGLIGFLVANLVDGFFLAPARIKPVG